MAYDIFISYRRKGAGAGVAGELQAKLENLGYKVFLDVDEIGSGQFPEQIERAISECKDFILVLSPGTLDRCVEEEDWVRREILQAQNQNKNIIGVGLPGFFMPEAESLPEPLKPMTTIQVFSWTHEYRTAVARAIETDDHHTGLFVDPRIPDGFFCKDCRESCVDTTKKEEKSSIKIVSVVGPSYYCGGSGSGGSDEKTI